MQYVAYSQLAQFTASLAPKMRTAMMCAVLVKLAMALKSPPARLVTVSIVQLCTVNKE